MKISNSINNDNNNNRPIGAPACAPTASCPLLRLGRRLGSVPEMSVLFLFFFFFPLVSGIHLRIIIIIIIPIFCDSEESFGPDRISLRGALEAGGP